MPSTSATPPRKARSPANGDRARAMAPNATGSAAGRRRNPCGGSTCDTAAGRVRADAGVKRVLAWFLGLLFLAATTAGLWLPPVISHAVEKDYRFTEVAIDATVEPNGDLLLEERRTFDFRNGPYTYAYSNVADPVDHVRDFSIAEVLDDGTERAVQPTSSGHSIVTGGFQAQWSYTAEDEDRTWVFRYRVACAAMAFEDTAHLYWQFIGTGWEKSTVHAVITVHLPDRYTTEAARPATCDPDDRPELPPGTTGTPLAHGDVRAF